MGWGTVHVDMQTKNGTTITLKKGVPEHITYMLENMVVSRIQHNIGRQETYYISTDLIMKNSTGKVLLKTCEMVNLYNVSVTKSIKGDYVN